MQLPTIETLDCRLTICVALSAAISLALVTSFIGLAPAGAMGVLCLILARNHISSLCRRVLALQGFLVFIVLVLPFSVDGTAVFESYVFGKRFAYSQEGLHRAGMVWAKASLIFIICWSMIGTRKPLDIGHALRGLNVPVKLTTLLFLSLRFIDAIKQEYIRLRQAMTIRGFEPKLTVHSLRTIGYLMGNILVRSMDRSERVLDAMETRGFHGEFLYLTSKRPLRAVDWTVGSVMMALVFGTVWLQFGGRVWIH